MLNPIGARLISLFVHVWENLHVFPFTKFQVCKLNIRLFFWVVNLLAFHHSILAFLNEPSVLLVRDIFVHFFNLSPTSQVKVKRSKKDTTNMMLFQTIITITLVISSLFVLSHAKDDEDVTAQAIRDMQAGMAGLKEASKNPAMLAQLMRDLQVSLIWSSKIQILAIL